MRSNQLVGAGSGKTVTLLCLIQTFDHEGVHGWVVNGGWNITFQPNKTICHSPSGPVVISAKILYTGDIPKHLRHEYTCEATYNEAIEVMNERMNSHVPGWVYTVRGNVEVFTSRFTNAVRAFRDAWNPRRQEKEYNDDIPF